jgi:RNA polymerase sigma-70 factor (ECF subfamily)
MDEPVLARLRDGDEDAFAELVDRYTPAMRHIARAYVRDDATADDVVQDAWLAVLRGLARYEGRGTLKGWIFAIVVNRAKTRGVRDGRSVPFSALARDETERNDPSVDPSRFEGAGGEWPGHWAVEPATWGDQPEARLLGREMRAELDAAIATLPDVQRTVVILRDIAGRTVPEVCELLDVTEANARVLLHRGRAKIRRALETYLANPEGAPA